MKPAALLIPPALLGVAAATPRVPAPQPPPAAIAADAERDPVDVVLLPGARALSVHRLSGSVALVSLGSGRVLSETRVGAGAFAAGASADGTRAAVSCRDDGTVALLRLTGEAIESVSVPVGPEPRGVAVSRDGSRVYVALAGADAVAEIDRASRRVLRRLPAGLEPWHVALTPDQKTLVVGNTRGRTATVVDLRTGRERYAVPLAGRNVRRLAVSPDGLWAYVPAIAERQAPADRTNIDRGWVVGNRLARVPLTEEGPREAITLDSPGAGIADVDGCALSPDGSAAALAASGSHEVVLIERVAQLPFVSFGGPGDHVEPEVRRRMRRIRVDGAPVAVRFTADGRRLVVSERFGNRLVVLERASGAVVSTIPLGGPAQPSAARRGERLFHDASRSFGGWYSCASCHTEGHTNGGSFDTLNDGGYGKVKKTPSLRGVARTGPWTWHGWQTSLDRAISESFTKSMQGPPVTDAQTAEVRAYLETLTWPTSPFPRTASAQRGEKVFAAKGCGSCHGGPDYASPIVVRAGLEEPDDRYSGFNPPTLRNVHARAPYLHDGRAPSLESLLTEHHRPSRLTGKPDCTSAETTDLIAFLKTL